MGKEWNWGGKSSKRSGVDRDKTSSAGCMCAVFQLFDFHQFQFTSLHQPQPAAASSNFKPTASTTTSTTSTTTFQPPEEADIPKGVEAPRNSLKSEEGTSLSSIIEDEDQESLNLNTPMGIQIKTSSRSGLSPNDIFSDTSSNSPGTKTPSLVARLMGLDLLPETNSPTNNLTSPSTTTIHAAQRQHHLSRSHTQPLRARQPGGGLQNKARYLLDSDMSSGTRSLPETPRISSSRRSDVDLHHHRLSLQVNKENVDQADLDFSKLSSARRKQFRVEEHDQSASRSPGHYARQIVKEVKESVSRKVGLDITNTVRNRSENYHEQLFHNQPPKSKRVRKGLSKLEEQGISRSLGKQQNSSSTSTTSASSSCSPRLVRFSESKTSTSSSTSSTTTTPIISTSPKDQYQAFEVSTVNCQGQTVKVNSGAKANYPKGHVQPLQDQQKMSKKSGGGGREGGGGAFGRRLQKMQEETFVRRPSAAANCRANIPDKKCKKTPLSNNLFNLNVVPTLLPVKKSPSSPPSTNKHVKQPAAEVPDDAQESKRSSQLSSSQSQKYHPPEPSSHVLHTRHIRSLNDIVHVPNDTTTTRGGGSAQKQQLLLRHYITRILARTGIANTSHVSFTNWFSPSHPLDPSIFHRLEISTYVNNVNSNNNINLSEGQFHLRCNRKLMFDIVDEILVDILRPYINLKPWINYTNNFRSKFNVNICNGMQGSELVDKLCSRIQSFPCADCQVLEDIDALIDKDLPRQLKIQREMAFEEEGEGVVMEIERDIVDTLVHETALILVGTWE